MYPGDDVPTGIPLIRVGDVQNGGTVGKPHMRISSQVHEEYRRTELKGDELLITLVGKPGACVIARPSMRGWNVARALAVARLRAPSLRPFVKAVLEGPVMRSIISGMLNTTVQPTLNLKEIRSLPVPVPDDLREAQRIGEVSELFNARIDLLRQTNATLESIAQAMFKSWFIDFDPVRAKVEGREPEGMDAATAALFPAEFEESVLGPIPKGWKPGCIGDLADVIDCLHSKKPELLPQGRPYLQLGNIRDDGLLDTSTVTYVSDTDYEKWTSRIEVREGDCVITNVGRVGAVAQIPAGFCAAMGRNMTAIRLRADNTYPSFLIELLLSPWMRAEIERRTDVGTILNALNVRSIPSLQFVLPPPAVLLKTEKTLRPLRASMENNLAREAQLANLRDTLLPRLISGKLRLPEAQEQVEDAVE